MLKQNLKRWACNALWDLLFKSRREARTCWRSRWRSVTVDWCRCSPALVDRWVRFRWLVFSLSLSHHWYFIISSHQWYIVLLFHLINDVLLFHLVNVILLFHLINDIVIVHSTFSSSPTAMARTSPASSATWARMAAQNQNQPRIRIRISSESAT